MCLPPTHLPESLIGCQVVGGHALLLAGRTGELVLTEVVLDAVVTVALPTARDDDRILHQLLAETAEQLRGRFQCLGGLFWWLLPLLPLPIVVHCLAVMAEISV